MNRNKQMFLVSIIIMLLLTLSCPPVFAAGGTGGGSQADSPGTPGKKPLGFSGVSLLTLKDGGSVNNASGAVLEQLYTQNQLASKENAANTSDIPLMPLFNFQFDKNVVNSVSCWTVNSKAFTMTANNNEIIPITVMKIDDTVDFARRQNIFIQPVSALQPGTQYQIKISPNLVGKNGITLGGSNNGQGVTITFKTKGAGSATNSTISSASTQSTSQPASTGGTAINWIVMFGAVLLIGWLLVEIVKARKRKS